MLPHIHLSKGNSERVAEIQLTQHFNNPFLVVCLPRGQKIWTMYHWSSFGGYCGLDVNCFYTGPWVVLLWEVVELLGGEGTLSKWVPGRWIISGFTSAPPPPPRQPSLPFPVLLDVSKQPHTLAATPGSHSCRHDFLAVMLDCILRW